VLLPPVPVVPPVLLPPVPVVPPVLVPPVPVVPPVPEFPEPSLAQAPTRRVRAPMKERSRYDVIECRLVQVKRVRTALLTVDMVRFVSDYFWRSGGTSRAVEGRLLSIMAFRDLYPIFGMFDPRAL
jgi:hypothetical protein